MAVKHELAVQQIEQVLQGRSIAEAAQQLQPDLSDLPRRLPATAKTTPERVRTIWERTGASDQIQETLLGSTSNDELAAYGGHIENLIGSVKIPVGIAGPLRINGLFAKGDFFIPMATTEAALVASYHRGISLVTEAGGCSAMVLFESVTRAPSFIFENLASAGQFVMWALSQIETFREIVATTTRHGKLTDVGTTIEGNHVYLTFEFKTADASGQNMVTIATQAVCDHIVDHSPVAPAKVYVEANLSGDKKSQCPRLHDRPGQEGLCRSHPPR